MDTLWWWAVSTLLGVWATNSAHAWQPLNGALNAAHMHDSVNRNDKCQIEIFTRGSCIINNNPLKPQVILTFDGKPNNVAPPNDDTQHKLNTVSKDFELKRKVAEEFVFRFIDLMKSEYGQHLQPLVIDEMQFVKLKQWGDANIYNLKILGLLDLRPVKTQLLSEDNVSVWRFSSILQVANLTAQFKVDANIHNKIVIKNWNLMLQMHRCLLQAAFEIDFQTQILKINSMHIKSFDNFQLVSETLSWPFNEIVSNIVNQEKYYIRQVIELNAQKYINMTLNRNINLNDILEKILRRLV